MKPGLWVPASMEVSMKKSIRGALAGIGIFAALAATSAPALAQAMNYPGMCTGYTTPGECFGCCATLAKGNPDCTNACKFAFPGATGAKAMMSPKSSPGANASIPKRKQRP
ncbi:MAG: hypothetical protein ACYCZ0_04035 [Minisyncoccota bacterium]